MCKKIYLYLLLGVITLTGGQSSWRQPIPDTDIVYQIWQDQNSTLGFVNADGTVNTILSLSEDFNRPVVSPDGDYIFGISPGPVWVLTRPAYWDLKNKEYHRCDFSETPGAQIQVESADEPEYPLHVLVADSRSILLIDLLKCEILKTLVEYGNEINGIEGFTFNPNTRELIYGLEITNYYRDAQGDLYGPVEYQLIKFDLISDEKVQLAEGINPSWSPDGKQITFTGPDGLYVINSDGSQSRRIFEYPFVESEGSNIQPPDTYLRWSPDGKWLVYSFCDQPITDPPSFCLKTPIYKISSSGGLPEQIVDDGNYPFWRP